jgi:hypothetical protein
MVLYHRVHFHHLEEQPEEMPEEMPGEPSEEMPGEPSGEPSGVGVSAEAALVESPYGSHGSHPAAGLPSCDP